MHGFRPYAANGLAVHGDREAPRSIREAQAEILLARVAQEDLGAGARHSILPQDRGQMELAHEARQDMGFILYLRAEAAGIAHRAEAVRGEPAASAPGLGKVGHLI